MGGEIVKRGMGGKVRISKGKGGGERTRRGEGISRMLMMMAVRETEVIRGHGREGTMR